ncbi:MAG: preprotein translocase subunit SecE [Candidatus Hydrogenedentota bacterium]
MNKVKEYYYKAKQFLKEVWVEVKYPEGKVTWPSKDEIKSATIVILLTLFAIGLVYIGLLDWAIASLLEIIFRFLA